MNILTPPEFLINFLTSGELIQHTHPPTPTTI